MRKPEFESDEEHTLRDSCGFLADGNFHLVICDGEIAKAKIITVDNKLSIQMYGKCLRHQIDVHTIQSIRTIADETLIVVLEDNTELRMKKKEFLEPINNPAPHHVQGARVRITTIQILDTGEPQKKVIHGMLSADIALGKHTEIYGNPYATSEIVNIKKIAPVCIQILTVSGTTYEIDVTKNNEDREFLNYFKNIFKNFLRGCRIPPV